MTRTFNHGGEIHQDDDIWDDEMESLASGSTLTAKDHNERISALAQRFDEVMRLVRSVDNNNSKQGDF